MLTPGQDAFVAAYTAGDDSTRNNGTASYLASHPQVTRSSAAVQACRLLKLPKVRARIVEMRTEAEIDARARLRSWWALAPDAQDTMALAAAGKFDPMPDAPHGVRAEAIRSGVRAAQEILNRAEGTPQQLHELRVTGGIVVAVAGPDVELRPPGLHNGHYVPPGGADSVQDARLLGPGGAKWTDVQDSGVELDGEPRQAGQLDPAGEPEKEGGGGPVLEGPPERYRARSS